MARNLNAKCKQCRRSGEKLFLKGTRCMSGKCGVVKRNFPPGFHGPKGGGRKSDYGKQLNEKQKARIEYRVLERQFRLNFDEAKRRKGNTGENFLAILESRLDNVVYRLGLGSSRDGARQMVTHGSIQVNGRKMSIPSYQVKTGQVIAIKPSMKNSKLYLEAQERVKQTEAPSWLGMNKEELQGKVMGRPNVEEMKPNFNLQMIVEYYSR